MKVDHPSGASRRVRRAEQMIIFRIAQQLFAISANAVQEVRSSDGIAATPADLPHAELRKVRLVVQRGQRTVYVVHGGVHFGLPAAQSTLILLLRGLRAALLVDAIDHMASFTSLQALPEAFCSQERLWYRGLVILDSAVIPVVNPSGLLRQSELDLLDAAMPAAASATRGQIDEARDIT